MSTLTGAMYTGISGLNVHSQAIAVTSDNMANVNTVGFKSSNIQFEDLFYSSLTSANNTAQVGHGATVSTIYNDFSQGAYEQTSSVTDMAIAGSGFFVVENPATDEVFYTRAGRFNFDDDGYLVNPQGYRVQGWEVDQDHDAPELRTRGGLGDIQVGELQSPPQATTEATILTTLDKESEESAVNATDPFFAMQQEWDGTQDEPLGNNSYTYQTTITVFDEAGTPQELTVYYDPVQDDTVVSNAGGNQYWEYIVTCDPAEDGRIIDGQDVSTTSSAGLLMTGTMTFDSAGELQGMTAFTLGDTATGNLSDLTNWTPADINEDGQPVFTANFSDASNASTTSAPNAVNIGLDFGISDRAPSSMAWDTPPANAAAIGTDDTNLFTFTDPVFGENTTTAYANENSTLLRDQDGFSAGYLESVDIDENGVISGTFTNGQTEDLYVMGLADFTNPQGLVSEGGNLFSASTDSGLAAIGLANTNSLGAVASNNLEMSNVDYSGEMVDLIRFQRGYSANSKIITTVDAMLQEAINLKR